MIRLEQVDDFPPEQVVVMTTGSQGEPMSALTRLSVRDHKRLRIVPGDTVVISATPIPGNEKNVARTINNLYRLGATVIHGSNGNAHVSGHASQEELLLMLNLVRPKLLHSDPRRVPDAGDARPAGRANRRAARARLHRRERRRARVHRRRRRKIGKTYGGNVLVDGSGVGDVGEAVLRDRKHLSADGIMMVVVTVDAEEARVVAGPDLMSRGRLLPAGIRRRARRAQGAAFGDPRRPVRPKGIRDVGTVKEYIRSGLAKAIFERSQRRPIVIPVVMEV